MNCQKSDNCLSRTPCRKSNQCQSCINTHTQSHIQTRTHTGKCKCVETKRICNDYAPIWVILCTVKMDKFLHSSPKRCCMLNLTHIYADIRVHHSRCINLYICIYLCVYVCMCRGSWGNLILARPLAMAAIKSKRKAHRNFTCSYFIPYTSYCM